MEDDPVLENEEGDMAEAIILLAGGIWLYLLGRRIQEAARGPEQVHLEEQEEMMRVQFYGGPQDGRTMEMGKRPPVSWTFPDVMAAKAVLSGMGPGGSRRKPRIPEHYYQLRMVGGVFQYHYEGRR